jgi:N-acyl-D-amino-acid deacylase
VSGSSSFSTKAFPPFDVVVENGTIIDGSGAPGRPGCVVIKGDKIVNVGQLGSVDARLRIDASGMVVAPGFVDPHSHTDWTIHSNRAAHSTIRQGVTTEIVGNCGITNAPLSARSRRSVENRLRLYGYDGSAGWQSFADYLAEIEEGGTAQNLAWFVGHSTIRAAVGVTNNDPTEGELAMMEGYVDEAMDAGALGLSTGLEYSEGRFAKAEEILQLVLIVGRHDGYYASHIRNRDALILEAVCEFLDVLDASGAHGQLSHLNVRYRTGAPAHAWMDAVDLMTAARSRGLDVQADMTPFEEGLGIMSGVLPGWLMREGSLTAARLLADSAVRERVRKDSDRYWRFMHNSEWDRVRLSHSEQFPELDGLSFPEIAERRRTDEWDAFFDILSAAGEQMEHLEMVGSLFTPADLAEQLRHPLFSCGVDACSSAASTQARGPAQNRLAFSGHIEYLSVHLRQRRTVSLPEMVRKLTSQPASRFGLRGRGRLSRGYFADLVVFDAANVASQSTFMAPAVYPTGVRKVLVNGKLVIDEGRHTGVLAGRVLRHGA